ncbi:MAG: hypothetical protein ACK4YP_19660 [Myxococcota bacterium]
MSPPPPEPGVADLVVFGGGHLGGTVARQVAAQGKRVLVLSPTPRPHAGLWRAWEAKSPAPVPLRGAHVLLALSPRRKADAADLWGVTVPMLASAAWREGAAAVTVCGPAGAGEAGIDTFVRGIAQLSGAPRTTVVRFGPLVGVDDGCLWPIVTSLRERGVVRLPRGLPPMWPLLLDDAARAVTRLRGAGGEHVLRGPEQLRTEDLATLVTQRFGGRWAWRWWGGTGDLPRLRAWENLEDAWDDARLGPRQTVAAWVGKLPGLRRRR